ncbi:hypothetical protein Pla123a_31950 [Posidoniimonas polymericola]|uniref:SGNH hydrolase-type esterase domain-containing protein n=1 Tax=Posidoniimonas polymericola TaxID=2528002 RepID=A0A5C5YL78_9BACT|nr:SGNH/GDSL hydrolase family protein [Posidoniimonas polymericola]TWT75685.1 hypothetical protein Pla123a_31950 [Posidoniimonas polymericola]
MTRSRTPTALFLTALFSTGPVIAGAAPADTNTGESDPALHPDGKSWGLDQSEVEDPTRPRVLLIGDSILNGYRSYAVGSLAGKAYVDSWVNPHYQSPKLNETLTEVIEFGGPYDVVLFNVGLHGYQEGRIPKRRFKPLTQAYVQVLRDKLPEAHLIWASSTPVTVEGMPSQLHPEINPVIVEHNRMAAEVMQEMNVEVVDYYGLLANKLTLARGDSFHWTPPAYKLLAGKASDTIRLALATQRREQ